MYTIINARNQRGWSRCDHLIDDAPLAELVGSRHRSIEAARKALVKRESRFTSAIIFEVRDDRGRRYRVDTSARLGIPGRSVSYLSEVTDSREMAS
jgi:hypothetical protein